MAQITDKIERARLAWKRTLSRVIDARLGDTRNLAGKIVDAANEWANWTDATVRHWLNIPSGVDELAEQAGQGVARAGHVLRVPSASEHEVLLLALAKLQVLDEADGPEARELRDALGYVRGPRPQPRFTPQLEMGMWSACNWTMAAPSMED